MSVNRTALKNYGPKARQDFIAAVTARAAKFGIGDGDSVPVQEQGELVIINGEAFTKIIGAQRKRLLGRIDLHGFEQTMEEVAYTWFNRFLAIRFMELHGYLDHGYRVLSHPDGGEHPEILEHAEHADLTGLDKDRVVDLKLDGTKDAELYRLVLIAQCNSLHDAMPFLFGKIDDETELLLPDNLLHTDSLVRQLVDEIDEADWQEIETIGWLYQFYISEKKDQVIGKVVKSEDIPAATQLFTPNWIVKYMVQNSLGHQWMATYPNSSLKDGMDYYIEPAEQSPEVQAQLAEITPKELNPEEMTLLDPAAGSGHILVEAYDLFKQIYLERGYRLRDIPRLILEKNLFGLDIDDRAAQMAGFALLMKARADDRHILSDPVLLNVIAIQSSEGLDAADISKNLLPSGRYELVASDDLLPDTLAQPTLAADATSEVKSGTVESLINLFEDAKTFGSLITLPENIRNALPALQQLVDQPSSGDLLQLRLQENAKEAVRALVVQATLLERQYDCVVANPPYIGGKYLNGKLKNWLKLVAESFTQDLFSAFVYRCFALSNPRGRLGFMTPFVWLFLSSYQSLREQILSHSSISSLVRPEYHAFFESAYVPICTFAIDMRCINQLGSYFDLTEFYGADLQPIKLREAIQNSNCDWTYQSSSDRFSEIPGKPIVYWITDSEINSYRTGNILSNFARTAKGLDTGENDKFLRRWHEVPLSNCSFDTEDASETKLHKWYPYNKGGEFRRWYGNREYLINWKDNGREIKSRLDWDRKKPTIRNSPFYFKESFSWTTVSSSNFSCRFSPKGTLFDNGGCSVFSDDNLYVVAGILNSKIADRYLAFLSPTLNFQPGDIGRIVFNELAESVSHKIYGNVSDLIKIAQEDWNSFETSWEFSSFPLLSCDLKQSTVQSSFAAWRTQCEEKAQAMKEMEEENNNLFIEAYGLQDDLTPDIPEEQIRLARANREEDIKRLISFSIGCMMGRYSLAEEGLIFANSGNEGFDPSLYGEFPADDDGIVPITDTDWFDDDATVRFEEFLKVAWSPETLKENLKFIGDSLAKNGGDDPVKTIRNYLSKSFYKDHLKTYKKRPIYWLFSSGKQRAFECLVYLHRYNEGILARMRMEYVTPLQSRMSARIEQLAGDIESASSSAERNRKQKEKDKLVKQLEELREFDEELRHYADQRIALDLDDGVKVNYGKFGNLLAEVKSITGKK